MAPDERPPATFTAGGKAWRLDITVADIRPLREVGLDLDKLNSPESRVVLMYGEDEGGAKACELLFDVLLILLDDQIRTAGIVERDFAKLLAGDALGDAFMALTEAVVLFSHRSNSATATAEIRAFRVAMARAQRAMGKKIDALAERVAGMEDSEIWNLSVGNSLATSA